MHYQPFTDNAYQPFTDKTLLTLIQCFADHFWWYSTNPGSANVFMKSTHTVVVTLLFLTHVHGIFMSVHTTIICTVDPLPTRISFIHEYTHHRHLNQTLYWRPLLAILYQHFTDNTLPTWFRLYKERSHSLLAKNKLNIFLFFFLWD